VRDVNFRIERGSVLGLLGPNGSGKSTTVSMLTGLLEPSGGIVTLDGVDVRSDMLRYKRGLGYVAEEAQLYTWMSGAEDLPFCARRRGLPAADTTRRIDALLGIFGLQMDRDAPMSAYSKGMRQKILLSAALLHNPSIIILDEPCSGLDVGATLVVRSLIQRLAAAGRMVIYSSHELEMVERVCSEVLILREGRVAAHAATALLRQQVNAASLEDAFRALVFTTDVDAVAGEILDAIGH
jgi:ABC-2 type transport system ATP-binding protein